MPQQLCTRGRELFLKATQADDVFKARLHEFFSSAKKNDLEMKRIEKLGERHREADEAFHRHQRFCAVCAEAPVTVLRYAAAD
jgi:hypothetical protein